MTTDDADESEPHVPVVCSACDTTSRVPLSELATTVERHNDHLHDGDEVAEVDPEIADQLADLVATDLGLLEE
ncbi:hypothetical protein [Natronolimnobius baerhuensis]|uniref:DUF8149 domain-containing protein n=1 Tax=Natronolimnobius baerhuensis TaxID=253108 RepID=A0A202ECK8_9EURY|nr:hypothetical protein [Natronolimnobius baerhuensis]OVE85928.1 hypothetical protein B2G88_03715 [Natronolimnobius baerhuensis]